MNERINKCSVEGCENQGRLHRKGYRYFPRGFCSTHYKNFAKNNRDVIEKNKEKVKCCSVEGCLKPPPYKKGLCGTHYERLRNHGDVNHEIKRFKGQSNHPLYYTWTGMRDRCHNPNNKDYHRYGAMGIEVCDRWRGSSGFCNFLEDMGEKPDNNYSIDRIDSYKGYYKENCRWADKYTQSLNTKSVKHRGVTFYKNWNKYRVRLTVDGFTHEGGLFEDREEAIQERIKLELKYLNKIVEV